MKMSFGSITNASSGYINRLVALVLLSLSGGVAIAANVATSPLFLTTNVKPNVILMVDNSGSMSNIVEEAPYNAGIVYSPENIAPGCKGSNLIPANSSVELWIENGKPKIGYIALNRSFDLGVSNSSQKCFGKDLNYSARLNADVAGKPGSYLGAIYKGNFLNWYFNLTNTTPTWGSQTIKPGTQTRIASAKTTTKALVNSLANIRLGLTTYNGADGGSLREVVGDISTAKKSAVNTKIDALTPSGSTPLAETLSDIGRYLTTGYTGNLTLYPDDAKTTASKDAVFGQGNNGTPSGHSLTDNSGSPSIPNPIQFACQKNFAVLVTDGRPQSDRNVSSLIRDYTKDCSVKNECVAASNTNNLPATPLTTANLGNGTKKGQIYESQGSDYLDDVASALYDIDLFPGFLIEGDNIPPSKKDPKNNLTTYVIGFSDAAVKDDKLLANTATRGHGKFFPALDSAALKTALESAFTTISEQGSSSSSVAANSTQFKTNTLLFQAVFDSTDWSGDINAFNLFNEVDTDNDGKPDPGEDTNSNGTLDTGLIDPVKRWQAAIKMPVEPPVNGQPSRHIFTYDPVALTGKEFLWPNLNATQKRVLDAVTAANASSTESPILNYLRGNQSLESSTGFRVRKRQPNAGPLGDIINSDPVYVSSQDFGYSSAASLTSAERSDYASHLAVKAGNAEVLYVGGNDGMLHAFDAGITSNGGTELFAYVPNAVISPELVSLSEQGYAHKYFVDGAPQVGDAYFGSNWHSVLIGSMGAGNTSITDNLSVAPVKPNGVGGRAIFALDVTNPEEFGTATGANRVLWEFSNREDTSLNDTVQQHADEDLGYTIPVPNIMRIKYQNKWAVAVANGYNSKHGKAVLFILDIQNGDIISKIEVDSSGNGLSNPTPVDVDDDKITDYIYAGDLKGNLWKFDITDGSNPNNWTKLSLFSAKDKNNNIQPITARPTVTKAALSEQDNKGVMIYFGTGKYFEDGDHTVGTVIHSFYGLWDPCDKVNVCNNTISGRSDLQEQKILVEFDGETNQATLGDGSKTNRKIRITSDCEVAFGPTAPSSTSVCPSASANRKGWFMDLIPPSNTLQGERVVNTAIVRDGVVIFTTLLPFTSPCTDGGTSWLMEVGLKGARLTGANLDVDRDGKINDDDLIDLGNNLKVSASGIGSEVGIIDMPVIIDTGDEDTKYLNGNITTGSNNGIWDQKENPKGGTPPAAGAGIRKSWRQLR